STRLKAGTATKVALNILSTGAMVRLGRVKGNLLLDMKVSNAKLRDRAARLVAQERGCSYEEACARLEACGWGARRALAEQPSGRPGPRNSRSKATNTAPATGSAKTLASMPHAPPVSQSGPW